MVIFKLIQWLVISYFFYQTIHPSVYYCSPFLLVLFWTKAILLRGFSSIPMPSCYHVSCIIPFLCYFGLKLLILWGFSSILMLRIFKCSGRAINRLFSNFNLFMCFWLSIKLEKFKWTFEYFDFKLKICETY